MKKTKRTARVQIGDTVALTRAESRAHRCPEGRTNNRTAVVVGMWGDGELKVDRDLRGCRYWNAQHLIVRKRHAREGYAAIDRAERTGDTR